MAILDTWELPVTAETGNKSLTETLGSYGSHCWLSVSLNRGSLHTKAEGETLISKTNCLPNLQNPYKMRRNHLAR